MVGWRKNHRARNEILGWRAGELLCPRLSLRYRHVTGRLNEFGKFSVCDVSLVHEETIDVNTMNRPRIFGRFHPNFVRVRRVVRAHRELSSRNPDHSFRCRTWSARRVLNGTE